MTDQRNDTVVELNRFFAELERVCPEAASGLAVSRVPPPMLSLRDRITILQTLSDNAGVEAFLVAWQTLLRQTRRRSSVERTFDERC
jgi:uncharacterized protein YbbK (DUF523 family)